MTDNTELKAAAEACGPLPWRLIELGMTRLGVRDDHGFIAFMDIGHPAKYGACPEREAKARFIGHATPAAVRGLIAENERLNSQVQTLQANPNSWQSGYDEGRRMGTKHRADEVEQLQAEVEALRKALSECAESLHGEMIQKFGGQAPDDMHPVTRRDYDRDMAEIAGYRAAIGKEG